MQASLTDTPCRGRKKDGKMMVCINCSEENYSVSSIFYRFFPVDEKLLVCLSMNKVFRAGAATTAC